MQCHDVDFVLRRKIQIYVEMYRKYLAVTNDTIRCTLNNTTDLELRYLIIVNSYHFANSHEQNIDLIKSLLKNPILKLKHDLYFELGSINIGTATHSMSVVRCGGQELYYDNEGKWNDISSQDISRDRLAIGIHEDQDQQVLVEDAWYRRLIHRIKTITSLIFYFFRRDPPMKSRHRDQKVCYCLTVKHEENSQIHDRKNTLIRQMDENITNILERERLTINRNENQFAKSPVLLEIKNLYRSICSNIVSNHFLESNRSNFNLVYLTCTSFKKALDTYCKNNKIVRNNFHFILKGGNVYKMITDKLFQYIDIDHPINYFKDAFNKSDLDFEILYDRQYVIEQNTLKRLDIVDELTDLSYHVLVSIRKIMLEHPQEYIDFYRWNKTYAEQVFQKYLKHYYDQDDCIKVAEIQFDNFKTNRDPHLIREAPDSRDEYIDYADDGHIRFFNVTEEDSMIPDVKKQPIHLKVNKALHLQEDPIVDFNLVRMKLRFFLSIETPEQYRKIIQTDGELIDVVITLLNSSRQPLIYNLLSYCRMGIHRL